jgi:prolyl-tRNA synthetase
MKLSKQLFQTTMKITDGWPSKKTSDLLEDTGFVKIQRSGFPFYLPLGERISLNLENLLANSFSQLGFDETSHSILTPITLIPKEKFQQFSSEIYSLDDAKYLVSPTTEDLSIEIIASTNLSYRQLPIKISNRQTVVRDIKRPESFLKTKQIRCLNLLFVCENEQDYKEIMGSVQDKFESILNSLNVPFTKDLFAKEGFEYFYPCNEGEKIVNSNRLSSLGMGYNFSNSKNISYTNNKNMPVIPIIGTLGFGIQKILHATLDHNRDELGFKIPKSIRPFEYSIVLFNGDKSLANECYNKLTERGTSCYLDDRENFSFKEKVSYSDFLGVPNKIVIGKKSKDNNLEVITRERDIKYTSLESI